MVIFLFGVAILFGFLWYFGTESAFTKRVVGTVLALSVATMAVYYFQKLGIKKGIELRGGVAISLRLKPAEEGGTISEFARDKAIEVLERRLDDGGTKELLIAPQGEDRVFIQMPAVGEAEVADIIKKVTKAAKLEFSLVHEESNVPRGPNGETLADLRTSNQEIVPGWRALPNADAEGVKKGEPKNYLVRKTSDMTEFGVTKARAVLNPEGWAILVDFDKTGTDQFAELSKNHRRLMAIIMDGEVLSAPAFNEPKPIYGTVRITGSFDRESAIALASALENPLQNEVEILSQNTISPTMGEETVKQGITAGVAGLLLTLFFIVIYYRFGGLLALVGLAVNIALIFGSMAMFELTLTLPGIAGIILTIGIAIDANVLIYERLREEMAAGKSLPSAVKTAYEKAFSAIIDANITTLITAIILFIVAMGTVKGFAVTLTVGILTSLFSALVVTRVCFGWTVDTGKITKMSFWNLIPDKQINFLSKRKVCAIVSILAVIAAIIIVPMKDPRGVDLKGGHLIVVRASNDITAAQVEESLSDLDLGGKVVVQEQTPLGSDEEFISIRAPENKKATETTGVTPAAESEKLAVKTEADAEEDTTKVHNPTAEIIIAELVKDLKINKTDTETESVGSLIGGETLKKSIWALGLGMVAILLYVTVRFEFAFALGAIVALLHDLIIALGIVTLFDREVSLITVGAFLTIAGYSINDTIVVFDRVREGLKTKRGDVGDVMNYCLNATLARTLLTSITTMITVITLLLFGGPALNNFAFTIMIGVLVGTYSSIFIASPIVLWWIRKTKTNLRREVLDSEQSRIGPADQGAGPGGASAGAEA